MKFRGRICRRELRKGKKQSTWLVQDEMSNATVQVMTYRIE